MVVKMATTGRESLGFLLADVSRLMRRAYLAHVDCGELTLAQARALLRISRQAGMRQIDLAEQMEIQPITLARLIDQLEKAGHVERRPDPDDRRAYRLHLTRKAAAPLAAINKVAAEVQLAAMKNLDKAEVEALCRAMEKMRGNLSERF